VSDCCTPKGYRTIFSEKSAQSEAKRYRRKGLDKLSRRIAELIKKGGIEGRTMLEVGGGIGAIELELVTAGAARATSVELTPTYEEAASELLRERNLGDRVERRLGDFVEAGTDLEAADIVILNRVVCCYPDMPKLVSAAAERTRSTLVLTFPNNRWWTRLGLSLVNLVFRLLRVQFQIFMHPPDRILAEAERHGLRARLSQPGLVWQLAAFDRVV
jgi:magnesium-protoporphyrin O-methyltransferase